jgi:hypothetical protein
MNSGAPAATTSSEKRLAQLEPPTRSKGEYDDDDQDDVGPHGGHVQFKHMKAI